MTQLLASLYQALSSDLRFAKIGLTYESNNYFSSSRDMATSRQTGCYVLPRSECVCFLFFWMRVSVNRIRNCFTIVEKRTRDAF